MIQRAPRPPGLRRIVAAQKRHREFLEHSESQATHEPRPKDENHAKHESRPEGNRNPSRESVIIRAVDRLREAGISVWRTERDSPSFVPQQYESVSVDDLPPLIGFEDDGAKAVGPHQRAAKAAARAATRK